MTRKEVIEALTHCIDWAKEPPEESFCNGVPVELLVTARNLLERQEGKWVPYEFGNERWHKCTNCGKPTQYKIDVLRKDGTINRLTEKQDYCPNCGAKMEEEKE